MRKKDILNSKRELTQEQIERRNALVVANLGFVKKIANDYRNCGVPLEDLIQEGCIGMIEAADHYDADRGVKFCTYAVWWIKDAIHKAIAREGKIVSIPYGAHQEALRYKRFVSKFVQENHREPTLEEYMKHVGGKVSKNLEDVLLVNDSHCVGLEAVDEEMCAEDTLEMKMVRDELEHCMKEVIGKDYDIFMDMFGYNGTDYSEKELQQKYGVSARYTSVLRQRTLQKIRESKYAKLIRKDLQKLIALRDERPDYGSIRFDKKTKGF